MDDEASSVKTGASPLARRRLATVAEQSSAFGESHARSDAATRRVLLVVRHPVGGIRTFFRYVYGSQSFAQYRFTLVCPQEPEVPVLLRDLCGRGVEHLSLPRGIGGSAFAAAVARIILSQRFDLVHAHGFTAAVASVPAARVRRIPVVATGHDTFVEGQFGGAKGRMRRTVLGAALQWTDRVHCVSDDARENLLEHLPRLRRRGSDIVTIRNGIDVDAFVRAPVRELRAELGYGSETFLVGFLGRFMAQKGFRYLVDAVAALRQRDPGSRRLVVLAFGGDDGFIREERDAVRQRGLSDVIRFLPFVPDVAATLKGLDVVAMPSLWEACPLLPMEAMCAGVPLIGTSCVALREILADTPAVVIPPRNSAALAVALEGEMRCSRKAVASAFVQEAVRRFDVRDRAVALEALLAEVIDG